MYVFANAMRNLARNRGRNLIMAAIVLVMLVAISVSAIIRSATDGIAADYRSRFGSDVYITYDQEKVNKILNSDASEVPGITAEQQLAFGTSEHLKQMAYSASLATSMVGARGVDEQSSDAAGAQSLAGGSGAEGTAATWNAKLVGYSANMEPPAFKSGTRKLVEGSMPKGGDEVAVSQDLAKLNGLKVGDTLEVATNVLKTTVRRRLKVVGVYFDGSKSASGSMAPAMAMTNPRNELVATADTVMGYAREIAKADSIDLDFVDVEATYTLKSPDDLAAFEKEVRAKGLPDVYDVSTDAASYDRIVKPMEGVAQIMGALMAVVLAVGGAVLLFLTVLSVRERKYEIGVLRAMGMKRLAVARGLVYESLALTAVCLAVGLGSGALLARPVSEAVLAHQRQAEQAASSQAIQGASATMVDVGAADDPDAGSTAGSGDSAGAADVRLTGRAAAEVSALALGIALASSAVGVAYVLRFEPMRILSERD